MEERPCTKHWSEYGYRVGKIMTLVGLRDVLMLLAEVLQVVGRVEKRIEEEKKQDLRRRLNK